mgnify:CR=1 FL=1
MNVSIITTSKNNETIHKAIEFATKRGITCEVVTNTSKATGEFLCFMYDDYCYLDYYIHIQYFALFALNISNDVFVFDSYLKYDGQNFNVCSNLNQSAEFIKKQNNSGRGSKWVEEGVYPYCRFTKETIQRPNSLDALPDEKYLDSFRTFFKNHNTNK